MASVKKTIEIIFAGTDKVSGTIATVSGHMSTLGDKINTVAEPLSDVADSVLKTNAALLALGIGGLTYAFSKSMDFEDATVELQKVLGDHPAALKEAQKAALDLSSQYGESSSDILLSVANFKQAGFEIQDSMILTKSAMDLSIAGNMGSVEASELLISSLKGFKAPASDAIRLVDVLNEVSNNYATSARELGIGMADLSPIAGLMGFSFEETAGILTPVIEIFRSGNEAAVALKTGLLRLIDDQKPVTEALASIGVAQKDANGSLRAGKDILYDVATAFKTAEENDKLFLAAQLVGIRQAGKMVEVFDGLAKSTEITSISMASAGSAAKEVAARLESGSVIVNRFKEGFANLAITIGDQFLEAGKESINGATAIENSLQQIIKSGTFAPVFDALSEFGENIGKFLKDIAIAMPEAFENINFDDLLDAIDDIGGGLGELFKDIDLTEPKGLSKAIQFIVDSLESLARITKGMIDVFSPIIKNIIETTKGFNLLDDQTKESAGGIFGVAKALTSLGVGIGLFLVTIGQHAEAIKKTFEIVINSIGFMWDSIVISVEGILLFTSEAVQDLAKALSYVTLGDMSKKFAEAAEQVQIFQDSLKKDIATRSEDNLDRISRAFGGAEEKIKEATKSVEEFSKTDADIAFEIESEEALFELEKAMDDMGILVKEKRPTTTVDVKTEDGKKKVEEFKKVIEKKLPVNRILEIELKGDIDTEIARIKATADIMQSSVEWTAKLNIADAENSAKMFGATMEGIAVTINSTADMLGGLFSLMSGAGNIERLKIEKQIGKESKMREEAHEMQLKLSKSQLDYMDAKSSAMESGQGLISITADGLEPEIEAFMWRILEKIQIRANEESAEFLLGI